MPQKATVKNSGAGFFLVVFGGCGAAMLAAGFLWRRSEDGLLIGGAASTIVGLFGWAAFALSSRSGPTNLRLLSQGRPGIARILDITRTGLAERNTGYDIGIAFVLLVYLPEREAYEVTNHRQMVQDIHIPAIQPGMTVRVFVHPDKDQELFIDFVPAAPTVIGEIEK